MITDDAVLAGVGQRARDGERLRRVVLVEALDRSGDLRRQAVGVGLESLLERSLRRDGHADALQRDAVGEALVRAPARAPLEQGELLLR